MLAPNKKFELSGLMTFRSNAAEHERDQLGTNTSAGRVLSFVEVSPQGHNLSKVQRQDGRNLQSCMSRNIELLIIIVLVS